MHVDEVDTATGQRVSIPSRCFTAIGHHTDTFCKYQANIENVDQSIWKKHIVIGFFFND